jgi:2-polyprenyl-3-methyl-5-hydroxy-6-metoxy-1,4-benzoquinol methylase
VQTVTTNALRTDFSEGLAGHAYPEGSEFGFWSLARHRVLDRALRQAARQGLRSANGKILEVGCGPGIVVKALRDLGHDIRGVELGEPAVRSGARDHISTGIAAEHLPARERSEVETLLLLDVIEHVDDAPRFLRGLAGALPNCKCVIVTVPARMEVWSNWDEYYGHFRRYSRTSLAEALIQAGFRVSSDRYFFRGLYLAARLINLLGRKRAVELRSPSLRPLQQMIALAFAAEDRLFGASPLPGMSLIAVAETAR